MSGGVRMTHPTLDDQPIEVPASAVPHWRSSGWVIAPDQDTEGEQWPAELERFEGQGQVRMRHPDLGEEITVAASAVQVHRQSGWVPVEEPAGLVEEPQGDGLDDLTVAQLKDEIGALNKLRPDDAQLPVSGTKAELLDRVRNAPPAEAPQTDQEAGAEPAQTSEESEA